MDKGQPPSNNHPRAGRPVQVVFWTILDHPSPHPKDLLYILYYKVLRAPQGLEKLKLPAMSRLLFFSFSGCIRRGAHLHDNYINGIVLVLPQRGKMKR